MLRVAILLVFVAVCWAQTPKPCSSPAQWEGRRVVVDRSRQYGQIAKYSYDATNKRTRSIEEVKEGKETDYFDVLHLYNENKEYRLNLKTRKCNVTEPRHPFFPTHVPEGSTMFFESEIGAAQIPGEHATIQNWAITFKSDGATYTIGVTSPSCVPIFSEYMTKDKKETLHESFYDIHAGITDPTAWIPPTECAGL